MGTPEHYSLDQVLDLLPMSSDALKNLVQRGKFVPRLRVGAKWFFRKDLVHRFIEENTIAVSPEENDRTWREIEGEARRRAKRKGA